jgi:uncharacterized protein GlcG (DUF336 family)
MTTEDNMLGRLGVLFDAIEEQAKGFGHAIVASAVDRHGNVMLTMRMDGAPVHSIDLATRKAFTAVDMRTDTMSLAGKNAPGEELFGLDVATGGKLVLLGGGDVFELSPGETIGVGISGAPTEKDIAILRNAVEKVQQADAVSG